MSPDESEVRAAAADAATSQVQTTLHVGITNCRKLKWAMLGDISKGIMLVQNEGAYEPWITTQIYSSLISHMQYILTLQGHHQVSIIIKILQKIGIFMTFKNFIHLSKECDLILTTNFVVTYNFIEVIL